MKRMLSLALILSFPSVAFAQQYINPPSGYTYYDTSARDRDEAMMRQEASNREQRQRMEEMQRENDRRYQEMQEKQRAMQQEMELERWRRMRDE